MRGTCGILIAIVGMISSVAAGQMNSRQQPCDNSSISVARVERPGDDWPLDFVKKSQILQRSPFGTGLDGEKGMTGTTYAVSAKPIRLPYMTISGCENVVIVSSFFFRPEGSMAVEKDGRTFAYIVWGQIVSSSKPNSAGTGADINVVFYDIHGAGHFDTVQVGSLKRLPFVPDWVK